jgi:glycosyltransferase involved in cell wall biosynthesis
VDYLIEAVPKDMPLEIIGQPYDSGFRERLGTLAAGKQVSFRHDCDDASLVEAYRQARCVVLPSVYRTSDGQETKVPELLGQTLLEGMACGLPGIGTAVASLPELIQDGITGFIVPPNDPPALGERLRQFRDQPELARRLGQAARRHVLGTFAWPNVVTRCLGVYRGAGAEAVHPR